MRQMKKVLMLLLCMGIILQVQGAVSAEAAAFKWDISNIKLEHKKISFTINQVDKAQNATVVVLNSQKEEILSQSYSISNQREDVVIELEGEKGLLADSENGDSQTEYYLYLKDEDGNAATDTCQAYLQHHNFGWGQLRATAYPNWMEITEFKLDGAQPHFSAVVGFQEYEGVQNEDGVIIIDYPDQEDGTYVQLKWRDDYGCSGTEDYRVKSEETIISIPDIEIWRDSITTDYYILDDDQRLAVKIGDNIYYGSYGAGEDGKVIVYPQISRDISSVTIWSEFKNGRKTQEMTREIRDCDFSEYIGYITARPKKAFGTVKTNAYGQSPVSVSVMIDGRQYRADIKNGTYTIDYPIQRDGRLLEFIFTDRHGCMYSDQENVENELSYFEIEPEEDIQCEKILKKSTRAQMPEKGMRLCVQIGNNVYYSKYSSKDFEWVRANYPQQKVGTKVTIWFEDRESSYTKKMKETIYDKIMFYTAKASPTQLTGKYTGEGKPRIAAVVSGKEYECKMVKKWDDELEYYYKFSVSYPKQKVNSYVKIKIADDDGYGNTGKVKIKNIPPKITISSITSGSVKITGKTTAGSKVTAKINGKKYKGKANKSGKYTIRIKQAKVGTKVKVSVVTPEGYTGSKTAKVKLASGYVKIPDYIFKTSSQITLKVQKGQKGDKVRVNVGGAIYTKTIKNTKKIQNVTVNINPAGAGTSITAELTDKFGKVKHTYNDMVYFGDTIYIGMTEEEACLTTWGTPQRNNWGGIIQWVYRSGSTTLYVYIVDGRVSDIQQLNY